MFEFITDVLVWTLFTGFQIYKSIARVFIRFFGFPIAKYIVNNNFKNMGWNPDGEGPLGITIHDETEFYLRLATERNFGLFEAHMDKVCTMNDIKALASSCMLTRKTKQYLHPFTWVLGMFNLQTRSKAWQVGIEHYDVGNDIYEAMLDKNMQYTCGYWRYATNLDDAQVAKMELIAQKLKLKPGMRVLDIGCGFGTLGFYLAKYHGVQFVGCSISKEQTKYGSDLCQGLPVEFRLCDYRELNEQFDRVVSVGMFEHVGSQNYREFFKVCHRCLKDDGILLLHTIGNNHKAVCGFDMWSHKYIFPNGYIPYYLEITKAMESLWIIEDWHNFGNDYSKTLAAWEQNFDAAWSKDQKLSARHGERFYRMWKIYLNCAQAFFLTRSFQLWQIVLTKDGLPGGYEATRL